MVCIIVCMYIYTCGLTGGAEDLIIINTLIVFAMEDSSSNLSNHSNKMKSFLFFLFPFFLITS